MKAWFVLPILALSACSDPLVPQQHQRESHQDTYGFRGGENPRIQGLVEAGVSDLWWGAGRAQLRLGFRDLDKLKPSMRLNTAEVTLEVVPTGTILKAVENTVLQAQGELQWTGLSFTAPPLLAGQRFKLGVPFRDSDNAITRFEFEFGP